MFEFKPFKSGMQWNYVLGGDLNPPLGFYFPLFSNCVGRPGVSWAGSGRAATRLSEAEVEMLDQTPGEMIIALRQGKIDLALTLHGVDLLSRDLYARKLATVRSLVAIPFSHRLDRKTGVSFTIKGRNVRAGIGRCGPRIHPEDHSVLP